MRDSAKNDSNRGTDRPAVKLKKFPISKPRKISKFKRYLMGLIIFAMISGLVFIIYDFQAKFVRADSSYHSFPKQTNHYQDIFPSGSDKGIVPHLTYFHQNTHPVATFTVLNKRYDLIVYRLSNPKKLSLKEFIQISWGDAKGNGLSPMVSGVINNKGISFHEIVDKPVFSDKLYFGISGKLLERPYSNDSLFRMNIQLDKAYGRYQADGQVAFYLEKASVVSNKPVDILFLDHHGYIYLLILSEKNKQKDGGQSTTLLEIFDLKY